MERVVGIYIPFINQISYISTDVNLKIDMYIVIKINGAKYIGRVGQKTQDRTIRHNMLKDASYIGLATAEEQLKYVETLEKTNHYEKSFLEAIKEVNIALEFIGVWPSINGRYVKFIYYASDKVDFRNLIKVLITKIPKHIRIELMQIGTREYNAMLGGFGMCGYELCCHNRNYAPPVISTSLLKYIGYRIDLKDQMTGNCGKYKCCLLYEAEEYRDFMENLPDYYQKIEYNNEIYTVMDINIFNMMITLTSKKEKLEVHYDEFIKVYNGNNT